MPSHQPLPPQPLPSLTHLPEWSALAEHQRRLAPRHLRELFADDPARVDALTLSCGDLVADCSKHRIVPESLGLFADLARACGLAGRIGAMWAGEALNATEERAVLHVALRAPRRERISVDGVDVVPAVHEVLGRMAGFADEVRAGHWRGATGERITTVVNIGIGGSDLGPAMAVEALRPFVDPAITFRFVSNVDGADLHEALRAAEPASTLVIVSSKTFTTLETMANARVARQWLVDALGEAAVARHMAAVSTNLAAVDAFGIDRRAVFGFWDWVGGRFSMDSAIGLSLMLAIGPEAFAAMLDGFHTVDRHLRETPFATNLPVVMALLGIWYRDFFGFGSHAVIPYSHNLRRFPDYLQQLEMESNGKRVRLDGSEVEVPTCPVVWGTAGTNGQHAYFQLLHQGSEIVPADLIGVAVPEHPLTGHHDLLVANLFAQSAALAFGRSADEVRAEGVAEHLVAHRTFPGNRPTTTILAPRLTPSTLGQLVALYEHKVFVQGVIWGVNSFDQWGVELGKVLASQIAPAIAGGGPADGTGSGTAPGALDASTAALVATYRSMRG